MDGYCCPACDHPVAPASWAEATSSSEAVLGRHVQSEWIEMRRCPGCGLLLRRAACEPWQPASPRLSAEFARGQGRANGVGATLALAAQAAAELGLTSREIRDEAHSKCAESRRIRERGEDIKRRARPSPQERDRGQLVSGS